MKPPNAPTLTIHNRLCYISGIHITRGLIIRYLDTDNEFATIPYDNGLIRAGAPREIPFQSLSNKEKIKPIKKVKNENTERFAGQNSIEY